MPKKSNTKRYLCVIAVAAFANPVIGAHRARAQFASEGPALPVDVYTDGAGIDLSSGRSTVTAAAVAIGDGKSPDLQLTIGPNNGSSVPTWGYVYQICDGPQPYPCSSVFNKFDLNGRIEWNRSSGSTVLSDGSQAYQDTSGNWKVYTKEGLIWNFSVIAANRNSTDSSLARAFLSSIQRQDGEVLRFTYSVAVPGGIPASTVTTTRGFQLRGTGRLDAQGQRIGGGLLINRATTYCTDIDDSCPANVNGWPSIINNPSTSIYTISGTATVSYTKGTMTPLGSNSNGMIFSVPASVTVNGVTRSYEGYLMPSTYGTTGGKVCDGSFVVTKVTTPAGLWIYTYNGGGLGGCPLSQLIAKAPDNTTTVANISTGQVKITDANNKTTIYNYGTTNWPVSPYLLSNTELSEIDYPEGNKLVITRDSRLNITKKTVVAKPSSGLADRIWQWGYAASCDQATAMVCDKPLYMIDANGNRTDYGYALSGLLNYVQGPPSASGVRPVTWYSYVQRYAWLKDAGGGYVQASSPVWVMDHESSCATSATDLTTGSCAAGSSDQTLKTYQYGPDAGPNNLLVRGVAITAQTIHNGVASMETRLTCYSYDQVGNRISETRPRAGLTVCP